MANIVSFAAALKKKSLSLQGIRRKKEDSKFSVASNPEKNEPVNEHNSETHMGASQSNQVIDLNGNISEKPLTYLDSTATALTYSPIFREMKSFLKNAYANTHTTGHHRGRDSTEAVNAARESVGKLVGYDKEKDLVIFNGSGATGPLNHLAQALYPEHLHFAIDPEIDDKKKNQMIGELPEKDQAIAREMKAKPVVITTEMEHHANQLTWFKNKNVKIVPVDEKTGELDLDTLQKLLKENDGKVGLVSVSGASNITGIMNPIYDIAKMAHAAGAEMCVDAAQLAPHNKIEKRRNDPNEDLDYIVMSPHKFGVPNTPGVLVTNRSTIEKRRNLGDLGGGIVSAVTTNPPEFTPINELDAGEEPGTPNIPGIVAVGLAADHLRRNMSKLASHEKQLTRDLMGKIDQIGEDKVQIIGSKDPEKRVGVVSFAVTDVPHPIVTSYLNDSWNIAVRNGCFCAHPYITKMEGLSKDEIERIKSGDRTDMPGYIRASLGENNTQRDVNTLVEALTELSQNKDKVRGLYEIDGHGNAVRKDGFSQRKGWDFNEAAERIAISEQMQEMGFNNKEIKNLLPVFEGSDGKKLLSQVEAHGNSKRVIQKVCDEVSKRDNLNDQDKASASREVLLDIYNPDKMEGATHSARAKNRPVYRSVNNGQMHTAIGWDISVKSMVDAKYPLSNERAA